MDKHACSDDCFESRVVAALFLLGLSGLYAFPGFLGIWFGVAASAQEPPGVLVCVLVFALAPLALLFFGVMFGPLRQHAHPIGLLRAILGRDLVSCALRRVGRSERWRYLLFVSLGVFALGLVVLPFV
jgi:hypothetical protein